LAKWIHPEDFTDLDPQATFDELHERFMPFEVSGQFWISLPE
jgi:iron complex transport system substrate-binding protein